MVLNVGQTVFNVNNTGLNFLSSAQRWLDLPIARDDTSIRQVSDVQGREETFEISISRAGGDNYRLEASGTLGVPSASAEIKLPSHADWRDKLAKLQSAISFSIRQDDPQPVITRESSARSALDGAILAAGTQSFFPPKVISEIGYELYNLLFTRDVYIAYAENLKKAFSAQAALKIQLCFDTPGLSYLPWETLYDGHDHLALSSKSSVIRNAGPEYSCCLPLVDLPIAVLGMVPRANLSVTSSNGLLNVEAEQANIRRALQPLLNDGRAVLQWTSGSASDLVDRLRRPPPGCSTWHVFHFSGHGGFNPESNKGYVVVDPDPAPIGFDAGSRAAASLDSDDLKDALEWSDGLRLVILNSCHGAMGTAGAASAAEELVTKGFSAVIAMQFEISDRAAILFSSILYKALAEGDLIHRAVTLARQGMKRQGMPEWITPVLYMRSRDGRLFRQ